MKLVYLHTWFRWSLGAVLTLLASGVLAPGKAHASCGDYLMVAPASTAAAQGRSATLDAHQQPMIPGNRAPCSGPSCSQRDPAPFSTPAAPAPVTGEQWGWVEHLPSLVGFKSVSWPLEFTSSSPIWRSDSIYHPPRLNAFAS
jgi:hypothetical protein